MIIDRRCPWCNRTVYGKSHDEVVIVKSARFDLKIKRCSKCEKGIVLKLDQDSQKETGNACIVPTTYYFTRSSTALMRADV
jgi:uncharacterized protein with PIN domain